MNFVEMEDCPYVLIKRRCSITHMADLHIEKDQKLAKMYLLILT